MAVKKAVKEHGSKLKEDSSLGCGISSTLRAVCGYLHFYLLYLYCMHAYVYVRWHVCLQACAFACVRDLVPYFVSAGVTCTR